MRKILSLITALVLCTMMMSAKTIYCKMEQGWWKADGAAVGCHSWGTPGPGTTWPGVRMTPVAGETDMWSIDLDLAQVQNVIFTRVNGSGDIADWGAKTKDLTIPTDDNNLFTITSSSAVWGDPGCEGEWSKYTPAAVTEPTVKEIAITGDKYVGSELTFTATIAGFSADPTIIYEVKAEGGEYTQAQGGKYTPAAAGDYTVKATAFYQPEVGKTEEASKEENFTVTAPVAKEYYLVGYINGSDSGCESDWEALHEEYKFVDGKLTTTFTEASYVFVKTSDNNHWYLSESYVAPAAKVETTLAEGKAEKVGVNGNVEVTFTITENQDGTLTLAYEEATSPVETKYYITGNEALVGTEKAWKADALEMNGATYTFTALPAGDYKMKVTNGTWDKSWGYSDLSETISTEGLSTDEDNNVCFTVYTPNDVTVSISEGHILIISGNFKPVDPVEDGFGIIVNGTETIKGTKNDGQIDWIEYMIEAELNANATFQLYDFANKSAWTESNIDEASTPNVTINANNVYEVTATGKYTIYLKMYGPENNQVYFAYDGTGSSLNTLKGQAGQRYDIMGQRVSETYRGMVIMNGQTFLQK